jgi:hypothetical protein
MMIGRPQSGIVLSMMENDSPRHTRSRIASIDPITGLYSDSPHADVAALVEHAACAVLVDDSTIFTIKNNGLQFPADAHFSPLGVPFCS